MRVLALILMCAAAFVGCKKESLTIATSANFAPFEFIEGKKFSGIDIEIAEIIAKELDRELVIKDMEFDSVVQAVASGNADLAISGLTKNETRAKVIDFSQTYFNAAQMVLVREGDERFINLKNSDEIIKKIASLKNLKIGAQVGTTGEFYAKGDSDWGFSGFKNASVLSFPNGAMAVNAMVNNQIDIVIIDEMPAKVLEIGNEKVAILDFALTNESYAIGVAKGKDELLAKIDSILDSMKKDGRMEAIINKYYVR